MNSARKITVSIVLNQNEKLEEKVDEKWPTATKISKLRESVDDIYCKFRDCCVQKIHIYQTDLRGTRTIPVPEYATLGDLDDSYGYQGRIKLMFTVEQSECVKKLKKYV